MIETYSVEHQIDKRRFVAVTSCFAIKREKIEDSTGALVTEHIGSRENSDLVDSLLSLHATEAKVSQWRVNSL